jgi:hypothetical protein
VETGWCHKTVPTNGKADGKKVREYNAWFQAQFVAFKECLITLISGTKDAFHAVAVRTYVEVSTVFLLVLDCWYTLVFNISITVLNR